MLSPVPDKDAKTQQGLTYVEVMITVSITAIIMLALMGVVNTVTDSGITAPTIGTSDTERFTDAYGKKEPFADVNRDGVFNMDDVAMFRDMTERVNARDD